MSTIYGNSFTVFSSVCAALKAGMITAMRFPLSIRTPATDVAAKNSSRFGKNFTSKRGPGAAPRTSAHGGPSYPKSKMRKTGRRGR